MSAASLALLGQCLLGLAAASFLCLSTARHARGASAYLTHPSRRARLRWAGWLLIVLMLMSAVVTAGWGRGLTSVLGALSLAAAVVVLLQTYRPRWVMRVAMSALFGGLLLVGAASA